MINNFNNEIPKARINITLDFETNGAIKEKELPLKLLILGDFSNQKTTKPLNKQERITVNKDNFAKIVNKLGPTLTFKVASKTTQTNEELAVKLTIDSINKFRPEEVVKQTPELARLLAMRNIIKDFKANLLDNDELRLKLQKQLNKEPHHASAN